MPARPQKTTTIFGLLGDIEGSYGGGATLTGADHAILLAEPTTANIEYLHGGERNPNVGAGGTLARIQPSGPFASLPVLVEAKGLGSAYDASTPPKDFDVLMRAAGHSATYSATPTPQWTYAPVGNPSVESAAFEAYSRGQLFDIIAANAGFGFRVDGPGFGVFSFDVQGLVSAMPTDVALPALTTTASVIPPRAANMAVTLGSFASGVIRSLNFTGGRPLNGRADLNSDGHAGFALGVRAAQTEIVLEAAALTAADPWTSASDVNPYELRDNATTFAFSWALGSVQYNRFSFAGPISQVVNVQESEDNGVAVWTITIAHHQSTPGGNDEYSLLWN